MSIVVQPRALQRCARGRKPVELLRSGKVETAYCFKGLRIRTGAGSVQREITLGAECAGAAVQRFAPELRGFLAFQPPIRARRTFDRAEMAERGPSSRMSTCSKGSVQRDERC